MLIAGRIKGATFVVGYVLVILLDVFAGVGP
jgi:hypothetical protein